MDTFPKVPAAFILALLPRFYGFALDHRNISVAAAEPRKYLATVSKSDDIDEKVPGII